VRRLLRGDPGMESQRIRELLAEQGYEGGKTIRRSNAARSSYRWPPMPRGSARAKSSALTSASKNAPITARALTLFAFGGSVSPPVPLTLQFARTSGSRSG
jgi:hypothetical protein